MRVLVCGGRDFDDEELMRLAIAFRRSGDTLIHGDARGADRMAAALWQPRGGPIESYPADWKGRGKMAGHERNKLMLTKKPDIVIALPGGTGTANMVSIAREAGVKIRDYR